MRITTSAPWHAESFERLLHAELPRLLAERLPLASYRVDESPTACSVYIALGQGAVGLAFRELPRPDADGAFTLDGQRRVVLPTADSADLDRAAIRCVGEQLADYIAARLGHAPEGLVWNEALAQAWLPLGTWWNDMLLNAPTSQPLDETNWLATRAHLRRLVLLGDDEAITPAHFGRICPVEAPEIPTPNRLLTIACGAAIRHGRLVVDDARPEATLGATAAMIPFLEHSAVARLLMGANLMRAWLPPPDPEPALVRTGNEPDEPAFWCGRNLLTAFTALGADTFEDAVVISQSCAQRLSYPLPIEPGDLLSNRHGAKGVVSRILPDAEMPRLPDGAPVELVYHFTGLISRMNFGQVREALMGAIARAEEQPAIVPPFAAPNAVELRARAVAAGLPENGMRHLTLGGERLPLPSTAGWVYWGRTKATAGAALRVSTYSGGEQQGELAYAELRDAGAWATIREQFNTRAAAHPDAQTLSMRLSTETITPSNPPAPMFAALQQRLAAAGIRAELTNEAQPQLTFRLAPPAGDVLQLAVPLVHPWLRGWAATGWYPDYQIDRVARVALPQYDALAEANARAMHVLNNDAPQSLRDHALADLDARLQGLFGALLSPADLRFSSNALFSARAVIVPGPELRYDQVGLPDAIAWALFGPLVARELADSASVDARGEAATRALDACMAQRWVLIYHGADMGPDYADVDTPFIAFRPLRVAGKAIRLHPLACSPLNADFDGDLVNVFLPLTEEGQVEAGERLSLVAQLARVPRLLRSCGPTQLAMWGLASLSRSDGGRDELAALVGGAIPTPEGFAHKGALLQAIEQVAARDGIEAGLAIAERLARRGFDVATRSGASMSPFFGAGFSALPPPASSDSATWQAYIGELLGRLRALDDFDDSDLGPQLLAAWSAARGNVHSFAQHLGPIGPLPVTGQFPATIVRHGYCQGLLPHELFATAVAYRLAAQQLYPELFLESVVGAGAEGSKVLARARRSSTPGVVFARAAAIGESDPLTSLDSRLFVGLPPGA